MNNKQRDNIIKAKGKVGEKYVCEYLKNKGYDIICTNYSSRFGEIDVIAENEKYIAFVEVKTRKQDSYVSGLESITGAKLKKFIRTAAAYLEKHTTDKQPRIDCVQLTADNSGVISEIKYIENAVEDWSKYLDFY